MYTSMVIYGSGLDALVTAAVYLVKNGGSAVHLPLSANAYQVLENVFISRSINVVGFGLSSNQKKIISTHLRQKGVNPTFQNSPLQGSMLQAFIHKFNRPIFSEICQMLAGRHLDSYARAVLATVFYTDYYQKNEVAQGTVQSLSFWKSLWMNAHYPSNDALADANLVKKIYEDVNQNVLQYPSILQLDVTENSNFIVFTNDQINSCVLDHLETIQSGQFGEMIGGLVHTQNGSGGAYMTFYSLAYKSESARKWQKILLEMYEGTSNGYITIIWIPESKGS